MGWGGEEEERSWAGGEKEGEAQTKTVLQFSRFWGNLIFEGVFERYLNLISLFGVLKGNLGKI